MKLSYLASRHWLLPLAFMLPSGMAVAGSVAVSGQVSAFAPPADPMTRFDGLYRGTPERVARHTAACLPGEPVSVSVVDGAFHYRWHPGQDAVVHIGPGGGYSATLSGNAAAMEKHMLAAPRIDGVADSHGLQGEYGTRWCKYSYRFDKS